MEADTDSGTGPAGGTPRQLRPTDVKRLNREWRRRTEGRLALLLDSVSQPFNVGSIVRTAAAFGVESVWLCGNTPDLDLPAVGKTALGTDRFLAAYREPAPAAAAKAAAEDGFRVVAVELASGAVPLFDAPLDGDVCLAIGNEDHGCSPALLAAVSSAAYIPQVGRVGSLNVAVAAAIALAEARRREWQLSPRAAWQQTPTLLFFFATGSRSPAFTEDARSAGRISGVAVDYLDHPRPLAFAHRGGAGHQPENSWRAFEYAVQLGYAYLETDTRTTSDGKLIAFHDAELDRVTDRSGQVSKLTWKQVSAARVHGTEEIPLLEDLIGTFPELRFNIDLKDEGTIGPLASVLKRTAAWDRVCVASFSRARLLAAQRSLERPICLAVTPAAIAAMRFLGLPGKEMARRLGVLGAACAQVPRQVATRGLIRRFHEVGLDVHVWTLNTRAEIERALNLGADGVMTDDVVLLRDILAERGQWHPRVAA